jgi:hypothetical protein
MSTPREPAGKPPSVHPAEVHGDDAEALRIRQNISQTRADMQGTLDELQSKLNPTVLKDHALEELAEVKATLRAELHESTVRLEAELKATLQAEVTAVIQHAKSQAKAAIAEAREDVKVGIAEAGTALRAATIGKVETMIHDARETVNETGSTLVQSVKENPLPAVLAGVGVAWLVMNARASSAARRSRDASRGSYPQYAYQGQETGRGAGRYVGDVVHSIADGASGAAHAVERTVGDAARRVESSVGDAARRVESSVGAAMHKVTVGAHQAQSAIGQATHDAGETIGQFAHDASEAFTQAGHDAQMRGRRIERTVETYYLDNPLAVGAVVVALGTLVGLAIPITAQEDRWMGAASDEASDKARSLVKEGLHQVDALAAQASHEASKALKGTSSNKEGASDGHGGARA